MRTRSILIAVLTFFCAVLQVSAENTLESRIASVKDAIASNPPPVGFDWEYIGEINAAFLKPSGWIVSKKVAGDFFSMAISLEDPNVNGKFQHGFTVIAGSLQDKEKSVVDFIRNARDGLLEKNYELNQSDIDFGKMKGFNCLYVLEQHQIGMFVLFVGNPSTNTFYQIIFESPVKDFDSLWSRFGGEMTNGFMIDDEL